ncbi:MAG: hypothetical protein JW894_08580 [Bacteroidales bacterium]|nr:hypothetical protein [Bacteroidales bacterium]
MKNIEKKSLCKFKEYNVDNMENIIGGQEIQICITFSGFFDGIKKNEDIRFN